MSNENTSTALALPDYLRGPLAPYANDPRFELILPSIPISEPGYGMKPTISIVQLSGDPAAKECFKVGARGTVEALAYTKQGLERIADAAGISIRTRRVDDRRNPDYCEFEAVGQMRNAQGELMARSGTAGISIPQWREDRWTEMLQQNAKGKPEWKKSEADLQSSLAVEMAQFRRHYISRCETKAALRVIRSFLAIKSGITRAEVERPKVLVRYTWQPDMSDPDVKRAVLARALGAQATLFGPGSDSRAEVVEPAAMTIAEAAEEREPGEVATVSVAPQLPGAGLGTLQQIMDGCRLLGINADELVARHHGSLINALSELNQLADKDIPF